MEYKVCLGEGEEEDGEVDEEGEEGGDVAVAVDEDDEGREERRAHDERDREGEDAERVGRGGVSPRGAVGEEIDYGDDEEERAAGDGEILDGDAEEVEYDLAGEDEYDADDGGRQDGAENDIAAVAALVAAREREEHWDYADGVDCDEYGDEAQKGGLEYRCDAFRKGHGPLSCLGYVHYLFCSMPVIPMILQTFTVLMLLFQHAYMITILNKWNG